MKIIQYMVVMFVIREMKLLESPLNYRDELKQKICQYKNRYYQLICGADGNFNITGISQNIRNCVKDNFGHENKSISYVYAFCPSTTLVIYISFRETIYNFNNYSSTIEFWDYYNICLNAVDIPNDKHYAPIQYEGLPIICEENYRLQEEYTKTISYCNDEQSWTARPSIIPCIQDCDTSESFLNRYKFIKTRITETYFLNCRPNYGKKIDDEIKCSLIRNSFKYLYGNIELDTFLAENNDQVCIPIRECPPLTTDLIQIHENSIIPTVPSNGCVNKHFNETCGYNCNILGTEKVEGYDFTCDINEDDIMVWRGMAYCRCTIENLIPNSEKTACETKMCTSLPERESNSLIVDDIETCVNMIINSVCDKNVCPVHSHKVITNNLICIYPHWSSKYHCACDEDYIPNISNKGCEPKICLNAPESKNNSLIVKNITTCKNLKIGDICSFECPIHSHKTNNTDIICIDENTWSSKYNCRCDKNYIQNEDQTFCQSTKSYYAVYAIGSIIVLGLLIFSFTMILIAHRKNKRKQQELEKE